jgi:thiol-disulfide isomerase/thioredoxin
MPLILVCLCNPAEGKEYDLFQKMNIQPIRDKKNAPNFSLASLEGKRVDLRNLKGKVVFINFWATWCGPCKEEMPSMEALHQQYRDKDFVFLTISVDYGGLSPVKEFIGKKRYTFPVLIDPKGETLDLFEVKGIPMTFVIDKKGRLRGKASGSRDWKSPEIIALVNFLLEEK